MPETAQPEIVWPGIATHELYGCFSSSAVQRWFRNIRLLVKRIHSLPGLQ